MRSREFTLPLSGRCAMGVCKPGCADAWVEFFLARYSTGVCKRLKSEVARIYVVGVCKRGCADAWFIFFGARFSMGFGSGWKVRSREFTSPLVARCAVGVCKRGCADAWVEFLLARYSMGACKRMKSQVARIYFATCWSLCYGGLQAWLVS